MNRPCRHKPLCGILQVKYLPALRIENRGVSSRNTVAKHVKLLENQGFIVTERAKIAARRRIKKNGSLLYTIVPMHEVREQTYEQQLHELGLTTNRQRVQKKLTEQTSA